MGIANLGAACSIEWQYLVINVGICEQITSFWCCESRLILERCGWLCHFHISQPVSAVKCLLTPHIHGWVRADRLARSSDSPINVSQVHVPAMRHRRIPPKLETRRRWALRARDPKWWDINSAATGQNAWLWRKQKSSGERKRKEELFANSGPTVDSSAKSVNWTKLSHRDHDNRVGGKWWIGHFYSISIPSE